jgi:mRNA-degrading endonuclease toxin of MazEF toxin-antitoxin module
MPLPTGELRRGRIVLALFPFAAAFPLRLADGQEVDSVESYLRLRGGAATGLVADARIRPVLLLHDRTRGPYDDVVCLRINSAKPAMRQTESWPRIAEHEHPYFLHLPLENARYGLDEESVIALSAIGAVHRSAIAGRRAIGELSTDEMQVVSERLARILSLDLAPLIAAQARELLRRLARRGAT